MLFIDLEFFEYFLTFYPYNREYQNFFWDDPIYYHRIMRLSSFFFQQGQSPQTAKDKPSASSRTSSQQPNRP
ncbi:hypothetical protein HRF54_10725 [Bacillus subtilis]|nr:hypothetical protein [Bacillus subtilis]